MVLVLVLLLLLNRVDQVRAFSDLAILNRFRLICGLYVHTYRRHLASLGDIDSILVDAFDNDRFEISVAIWPKHHMLVKLDLALKHSTAKDKTHTFAEVTRVNNEFCMYVEEFLCLFNLLLVFLICAIHHLCNLVLLSRRVFSDDRHWHYGEKLSKQLNALTCACRDRENGANTAGSDRALNLLDVLVCFHENGNSVAVLLHDASNLCHIVVVDFFRRKIDFSENDE